MAWGQSQDEARAKRAVVTNREVPKGTGARRTAFFDIKQAGDAAGDWIKTVSKDLEKRFGNVDVVKVNDSDGDSPLKELGRSLKEIHPLRAMNSQVKNQIKLLAKDNSGKLAALAVEAGLYCSAFHHCKERAKRATRDRKYSGPAVRYLSDVMMPTGLYGPIFGFLIRLALPF